MSGLGMQFMPWGNLNVSISMPPDPGASVALIGLGSS